ncbi:hypothetical protein BKA56DRAFT_485268, partial [Ilyonectria sp. MPI-CAGE-AT-0026]
MPLNTGTYPPFQPSTGKPISTRQQQTQSQAPESTSASRQGPTRPDLRVLFRLHLESRTWQKQGYTIRQAIVNHLKLNPNAIPRIDWTKSGFAIHCKDAETQQLLLGAKEHWCSLMGAYTVDKHQPWTNYVVPGVPRIFRAWDGEEQDPKSIWRTEIIAKTGLEPVSTRLPVRDDGTGETVSLLVSFLETVRTLEIFGQRERLLEKNRPITRQPSRMPHDQQNVRKPKDDNPQGIPRNVGKSRAAHDAALALAAAHEFEIVLLQEPHTATYDNGTICRTRSHFAYLPFTPVTHWTGNSERPRVATYVATSARMVTEQITTFASRDL